MPPPRRSKEPNNPHDALFRKTFSNVEHARAALRAVLPSELLSRIALPTLQLVAGSYVDAELASSQSDLLFMVEAADKPGVMYLLFEHQSSVDELMPLRVLKYAAEVLAQHVRATGPGKQALPLPLVVTVLLHHSEAGWTAGTSLTELFNAELVTQPSIAPFVPQLRFVLDDISGLTDDELSARALGLVPTLTLWALRDARSPGRFRASLLRWGGALRALAAAEDGEAALYTIFRYLSLVVEDLPPQVLHAALHTAAPETEQVLMTLAEQWRAEGEAKGKAEGEAKGKAEGKAEGEAKGKAEGARRVLFRQLELKFGEVPGAQRARVEQADEDQLLLWSESILTAESLSALLNR